MDTKRLDKLSQEFRTGAINRRAFIQNVVLTAGGAAAASHVLKKLGFDADLVREARAENGGEIIEDNISYPSPEGDVTAFLARPAQDGTFPTMIVIHEIFGLSDFVKEVARLFARTGYLALAPALPEGGGDLPDGKHAQWMLDTIRTGVANVPDDEQVKLAAGFDYLTERPDVDASHIGSVGFCWGGARSFTLATRNPDLWVAVVFYGSPPSVDEMANIRAPVLGLYGALDNSGLATSPTGTAAATARTMASFTPPKVFEWEVYNRAAHGFFRGDMPPGHYIAATREAGIARDLVFDFLYRYY